MHNSLFADQKHLDAQSLRARADKLTLDVGAFDLCVRGVAAADRVKRELAASNAAGFRSTPTFLVGRFDQITKRLTGDSVFEGLQDGNAMIEAIERLIRTSR